MAGIDYKHHPLKASLGWHPWCAACRNAVQALSHQRRNAADPEGERVKRRGYYERYMHRNPERKAKYRFDAQLVKACKRAGITVERYQQELLRQDGVCKICQSPQRDSRMKRLVIDHDHVTGDFRGLLCSHCNAGLGHFGDNAAIMEEAIAYLKISNQLFKVVTLPSA